MKKDQPECTPANVQDSPAPPEPLADVTLSHLMPTLQGAPVGRIALTEEIDLSAADVSGRYTNATEYGRGGMGRVLLVHDTFLSREVALKELIPQVDSAGATAVGPNSAMESAHLLQRFLREARITGNLEHPSIVPVYELGRRPDGAHYYTMKLVRGRTLHRAIHDARNLEERLKLLPHVIDMCHAIAYAHSKNVIHRDIKPSNVMVGSYGETVVIDWGLARVLGGDDPYAADLAAVVDTAEGPKDADESARTMAGVPVGTPHYMSPEQAAGRLEDVGAHSDVYALGVALYELLAGATPFTGTRSREVLNKVLHTRPAPVTAHEPNIPPALAGICAKAMERRPEDRYGSAAELAEELNRFATGALVRGYEYNFWELARHYYKQHKALCNTVLVSAVVVMTVVVVAYAYILDANRRERLQRQAAEAEAYRANIQVAASDVKSERFQKAREHLLLQPPALRDWEWRLLFEECNQDHATGLAHTTRVHNLIAAPLSNRIITIGGNGEVLVWSTPDLELVHRFDLPPLPSAGISLTPDERYLAISRLDGVIELYDFADFTRLRSFEAQETGLNSGIISADGTRLFTAANDGTLAVWNAADGSEVARIPGEGSQRYALGANEDASNLLTADANGNTVLWRIDQGVPLRELSGGRPTFTPYGQSFMVRHGAAADVYSMDTGEPLFHTEAPSGNVESLLPSGDGKRIAILEPASQLQIWDVARDKLFSAFDIGAFWRVLGLNADGSKIAIAVQPNSIEIRNVVDGTLVCTLRGHSDHVEAGAFGVDDRFYFSCGRDKEVKAWAIDADATDSSNPRAEDVTSLAWSAPAGLVAAATLNGTLHFLSDVDFSPVLTLSSFETSTYTRAAFHPNGKRALLMLGQTAIQEISLPEGELLGEARTFPDRIRDIAYSPDGTYIAVAYGRVVDCIPSERAGKRLTFSLHEEDISALAFSASGPFLVSASRAGDVRTWEWRSGEERNLRTFANNPVVAMATSPNGNSVAGALADNSLRVFPSDTDQPPLSLLGHNDAVQDLTFSDNGTRLISVSKRGEVKIWSTTTGQELLAISTDDTRSSSIVCTGSSLLLAGGNPMLQVYRAFPAKLAGASVLGSDILGPYRRDRPTAQPQKVFQLPVTTIVALTTASVLKECADRLGAEFDNAETFYVEPDTNPFAKLGLRPGDEVTTLDGRPYAGVEAYSDWLRSVATSVEREERRGELRLRRGDLDIHLRYQPVPEFVETRTVTLARDEALALIRGLGERLREYENFILDYSQRYSRAAGATFASRTALDGLWILPPDRQEDLSTLQTFGLVEGDCIVSINEVAVSDYSTVLASVHTAAEALQDGWSGAVAFQVERGRFQQIDLRIVVP